MATPGGVEQLRREHEMLQICQQGRHWNQGDGVGGEGQAASCRERVKQISVTERQAHLRASECLTDDSRQGQAQA